MVDKYQLFTDKNLHYPSNFEEWLHSHSQIGTQLSSNVTTMKNSPDLTSNSNSKKIENKEILNLCLTYPEFNFNDGMNLNEEEVKEQVTLQ